MLQMQTKFMIMTVIPLSDLVVLLKVIGQEHTFPEMIKNTIL